MQFINTDEFTTNSSNELKLLKLLQSKKFEIDFYDYYLNDSKTIHNVNFEITFNGNINYIQYHKYTKLFSVDIFDKSDIIMINLYETDNIQELIKYIKLNFSYKNRRLKLQIIYDTV